MNVCATYKSMAIGTSDNQERAFQPSTSAPLNHP